MIKLYNQWKEFEFNWTTFDLFIFEVERDRIDNSWCIEIGILGFLLHIYWNNLENSEVGKRIKHLNENS